MNAVVDLGIHSGEKHKTPAKVVKNTIGYHLDPTASNNSTALIIGSLSH